MARQDVVLVNNSRETFTPTVSGAIATCLWEVANAAASRGDSPLVLSRPHPAEPYPWGPTRFLAPTARSLPSPVDRAMRRATGWAADRRAWAHDVLRHLKANPARTVICNNDPELAVVLDRGLPGTRVVHWFHNLELSRDRWTRGYMSSSIRSVAVSDYLARAAEQVYTLEPRSVEVAHNGVDTDRFAPTPPADDTTPRPVVLGFLGRVAVEKAPDVFLEAALLLAERGLPFSVQLLGDTNWHGHDGGPYGTRVRGLVERLLDRGVAVRAPGHVVRQDVPAELRRADVHVVPSGWDEPFGLTTLEGMASGLAVVATATGGTPEVVGDAGVLVPRNDPGALADALARLVTDREALQHARVAARRRAETFTWDRTWAALHGEGTRP